MAYKVVLMNHAVQHIEDEYPNFFRDYDRAEMTATFLNNERNLDSTANKDVEWIVLDDYEYL